jgi:hypothetical protein
MPVPHAIPPTPDCNSDSAVRGNEGAFGGRFQKAFDSKHAGNIWKYPENQRLA